MTYRSRALITVVLVISLAWPIQALAHDVQGVEFVGVDEVYRLQTTPQKIVFVDVRSTAEFQDARIKGAVNVPVTEIEQRFAEIPRQGLVVLY